MRGKKDMPQVRKVLEVDGNRDTKSPENDYLQELNSLKARRASIQENIAKLQSQIYGLETSYLENTNQAGNCIRGWENYLSSRQSSHKRKIREQDRLFSASSASAARLATMKLENTAVSTAPHEKNTKRKRLPSENS